ncbi:hypothetical protein OUZ56_000838 [Daphnia magna]|uniref:Uncharacterized protein n=1 Tax=Daphnia magna TaxID=35525 RepID=A0ABR0A0W9_9CRUS|nr:hypothetical protein OUZ56_000838 [Daphnia magna]
MKGFSLDETRFFKNFLEEKRSSSKGKELHKARPPKDDKRWLSSILRSHTVDLVATSKAVGHTLKERVQQYAALSPESQIVLGYVPDAVLRKGGMQESFFGLEPKMYTIGRTFDEDTKIVE